MSLSDESFDWRIGMMGAGASHPPSGTNPMPACTTRDSSRRGMGGVTEAAAAAAVVVIIIADLRGDDDDDDAAPNGRVEKGR